LGEYKKGKTKSREKIRPKVRGQEGPSEEKWILPVGILKYREIKGKEKADGQDLDELLPLHPDLPLSQTEG